MAFDPSCGSPGTCGPAMAYIDSLIAVYGEKILETPQPKKRDLFYSLSV